MSYKGNGARATVLPSLVDGAGGGDFTEYHMANALMKEIL